jgi:hypothetical protein
MITKILSYVKGNFKKKRKNLTIRGRRGGRPYCRGFGGFSGRFRLPEEAHFIKFPHFGKGDRPSCKHFGCILMYYLKNFTFIPHFQLPKTPLQGFFLPARH